MTHKQLKALEGLFLCDTHTQAAEYAGISTATLRRYLNDDEFQREYKNASMELIRDATRRAQKSVKTAVETLEEIAGNAEASDANRVSASRSLLEYCLRLTEFSDVIAELRKGDGYVL